MALLLSITTTHQAAVGQLHMVESSPIIEAASAEILKPVDDGITSPSKLQKIAPITVETVVRAYFSKTPVLAEIARCESQFRQFDKSGDILRGRVVASDVGVMQINEYYHGTTAEKIGVDLHTLEGNLAYAKYLFSKQGTQPWQASSACWDK